MANVINKINIGTTEYALASTAFATCTTAGATVGKVAYILSGTETTAETGFTLTKGVTVYVQFTNTNTASNPTLNINNCGAKAIQLNGTALAPGALQANCVYAFLYTGTVWELVSGPPTVTIKTWEADD